MNSYITKEKVDDWLIGFYGMAIRQGLFRVYMLINCIYCTFVFTYTYLPSTSKKK